jgi:hypothetical protein
MVAPRTISVDGRDHTFKANGDGTITLSNGKTGFFDMVTGVFTEIVQIKADAKVKTYTRWAMIGGGALILIVLLLLIFKKKKK